MDSQSPNVTTPQAPGHAGSLPATTAVPIYSGILTEQSGVFGAADVSELEPGAVAMFGIGVVFAGPAHRPRRWFD